MRKGDPEVKKKARILFLRGDPALNIIKACKISSRTLYHWVNTEKWKELRVDIESKKAETNIRELLNEDLEDKKRTLGDLKIIKDKAIQAITEDKVRPSKFSDTTFSYISAVRTEKEFREDLIKSGFINIVIKILSEEIADDEQFYRIGKRLQSFAGSGGSGQQNYLLGPGKNVEQDKSSA